MKKIKIRTKMMLWYTLLTAILLITFIPILYNSISNTFYSDAKSILRSTMSTAATGIEFENNIVSWDENIILSDSRPTFVLNMNNQLIYSNSSINQLMEVSYKDDTIRTVESGGQKWLVMDETISKEGLEVAQVKVFISLNSVEKMLNRVKLIILFSVPAYFLITIVGGLFIAKKALQPINQITKTAKIIGRGDLSSRIAGVESHDEVGELSETFNEMLDKLEESFDKEKRFASDASHELRTPVAIIMAYSEALLAELGTEKNSEDLEKSLLVIHKESERMNSIISQLLMLSRGFEGKYKLVKEEIDISAVIENVIGQLEDMAEHEKIQLMYKTDTPIFVKADQSLITHMMLNFVENAIKYGVAGGHVWVDTVKREDELIIIIEDDGIGIEPEHLNHIFERFYRADQSRDRSGTGLGLSLVKWIVGEHGGNIEVSSQPGKGTTFEVHLKSN